MRVVRALTGVALVSLSACGPGGSVAAPIDAPPGVVGTGDAPTASASPRGRAVDPEATLTQQAAAMRALVRTLIADVPATDWAPSADGDTSCAVGTGERWPRQWAYAQRAFTVKDPKAHADRIVAALAAQGWSVTPEPAGNGQETRQLQRNAVLVIVSSASGPDVLDVHAVSPCVQADGTLDTRPVV